MKTSRLLGHPIHPMLIVFPLGLLGGSVAFDIVRMATGDFAFAAVTYWLLASGLIGGLLAAIFGVVDWLAIPGGTRARRIGLVHGLTMVVTVALFAISWWIRRQDPDLIPSTRAVGLSFAGLAVALVGGWLGGELVDRLGVGVDPDANLNAPSSLSSGGPPQQVPRPRPIGGIQSQPR